MFCNHYFSLVEEFFITPNETLCALAVTSPRVFGLHGQRTSHQWMRSTLLPSFPRFLKGLPVKPAPLSDELKAALGMEPIPGGIKYIIATQVSPGTSLQPQGPGAPMAQHT